MKEKLTLRNLLLCGGALAGLVAFVFTFLAKVTVSFMGSVTQYKNAIWGAKVQIGSDSWLQLGPSVLPMIGAILIIVAAICAGVMLLAGETLVKEEKIRKIILWVAAGLMVVGGVLLFFTLQGFVKAYADKTHQDYSTLLKNIKEMNPKTTMSVIAGIGAILGGLCIGVAPVVKQK